MHWEQRNGIKDWWHLKDSGRAFEPHILQTASDGTYGAYNGTPDSAGQNNRKYNFKTLEEAQNWVIYGVVEKPNPIQDQDLRVLL